MTARRLPPALRFLTATALLLATACTDSKLDAFDITRTATATIAGSPLPAVLQDALGLTGFGDMDFAQAQEFKNAGVKPNEVDSVKLQALSLQVQQPPGQDLTFFDSIAFYAEADGLPKLLVADAGPFTKGQTAVSLTLHGAELKPYVTAAKMSLTTKVNGHAPPQETKILATVVLRVDVNVTGVVTGK